MGTEKRERQKANRALRHQQEVQAASRRQLYRKIALGVAAIAAIVLFVWIASNVVGGDDDVPTTPDTIVDTPIETAPDATTANTNG